uniref:Myb-like domain-containing protein n=1 Tax=Strongyloides venezuelensis TaxID=75913 RepID=A0A0K0F8V5_STRVS
MNSSFNISNFLPYQHEIIETSLKKYLLKCKTEGGDWELAELGHLLSTLVNHGISDKAFERLAQVLRPKTINDIKNKYNELLEIIRDSKEVLPEKWLDESNQLGFLNTTAKEQLNSNINSISKLQSVIPISGKVIQGKRETAEAFPFVMEKIIEEDVEDFNMEDEGIFKGLCASDQNVNFSLINKQISNLLKGNKSNILPPPDVAVFASAINEVISLVDEVDENVIDKIRLQLLRNIENKTLLPLEDFKEENIANNCVNYYQLTSEFLDSFNIENLVTKLLKDN